MDVAQLLRLEEDAWASKSTRALYATPIVPGFPWYTVADGPVMRRCVVPYFYTFRVFVKGRWVGRQLLDIYSEELTHHSREYYEACIQQGRLRRIRRARHNVKRSYVKREHGAADLVDASSVTEATPCENNVAGILEHGDIVLHTVHRHEVPVCMGTTGVDPILLIAVRIKAYGLLVVHKPAGVPTHASGRYFMNSCTAMLEYVLAPKRLRQWLVHKDPLLQSVVSTMHLSEAECEELLAHYETEPSLMHSHDNNTNKHSEYACEDNRADACESVALDRLPRPCHRLDKVTSGVLLLGVSQAATHRVGEALTRKTKQMEDLLGQNFFIQDHTTKLEESALEKFSIGVRKRYLARVYGHFPTCALESCGKTGLYRVFTHHTEVSTKMEAQEPCLGPTVLLASPLVHYRYREGECEEVPLDKDNVRREKKLKEPVVQEAATLCQPLCHMGDESLVQCIPFSGRMHQIRIHLSEWGHPISGDVCYGDKELRSQRRQDMGNEEKGLHFDPSTLPKAYRMLYPADNELCWECTGKLPIASMSESNCSAIALHAWRYEVDAALLGEGDASTSAEERAPPPGMSCHWDNVVGHVDSAVRRQGHVIVFTAPPPAWAQKEQ